VRTPARYRLLGAGVSESKKKLEEGISSVAASEKAGTAQVGVRQTQHRPLHISNTEFGEQWCEVSLGVCLRAATGTNGGIEIGSEVADSRRHEHMIGAGESAKAVTQSDANVICSATQMQ
jgi:hypothetical protein